MKTIFAATIAVSLLSLGAPLAATSAPGDPVIVNVVASQSAKGEFGQDGVIELAFQNQADTAATSVEFRLTDIQGHRLYINDAGRFQKGVWIRHQFVVQGLDDAAAVRVAEVAFADGSTWQNPLLLPPRPRRQASASDVSPFVTIQAL